jgi:hypothetical protein
VDLDSVTDELYALQPGEFTATRNERAKQARTDGDRALAEQIRTLDKPTTSAWLVNQLARQLGDQLEPLIALGRELREATANISGEELRALTRQRHQLVHALVQEARRFGARHGTKVTDAVAGEVQRTLDASLADPGVAEAVLSGRLAHATEYAGFGGPMTGQGAPTSRPTTRKRPPERGATAKAQVTDLAARRRESAQRALTDAEERLRTARSEHESAAKAEEDASASREQAEQRLERLRAELDTAHQDARAVGQAERRASERVKRAERDLRRAEQAQQEAAARLADLAE